MFIKSWSEIDAKAPSYYEKIILLCKKDRVLPDNITFIVVDHCLQTFESHVESLSKLGKIAGVILKSSTRLKEAEEFAKKYCKVLSVTKEDLMNSSVAIKTILDNTSSKDKLIILDHGGYFAPNLKQMMNDESVKDRLLGIVEVTENGHYKHEKALQETSIPLISIARSEIKELEDIQVGVSICDATDTIMYSIHTALTSLQHACVLGYGKIGRSIANNCRKRGIPEVTVIEIDSLRAQLAIREGHTVIMGDDIPSKIKAFQKAQIIFSATGSRALSKADIPHLRNTDKTDTSFSKRVTFISSCTSPDDEFNPDFLQELEAISKNGSQDRLKCEKEYKLSPYELFDGRQINILNGGKAVNFAIGGTPGYEICQVWAAILYSAAKLAAKELQSSFAVQSLRRDEQVAISRVTQSVFFSEKKEENKIVANNISRQRSNSFSSTTKSYSIFQGQQITNESKQSVEQTLRNF